MDRAKFIGDIGQMQKAMGRTCSHNGALKLGADIFLSCLQPWKRYSQIKTKKHKPCYIKRQRRTRGIIQPDIYRILPKDICTLDTISMHNIAILAQAVL